MDIKKEKFGDINLNEKFFDSLRESYESFDNWFRGKAEHNEEAYVYRDPETGLILDFLYLK